MQASAFGPLTLQHVIGLKGDVTNCIHYVDETHVVYPAGYNVVVYDTVKKVQRFIVIGSTDTPSSCDISAMAMTSIRGGPKSRLLAVAERGDNANASVQVFELPSGRLKTLCALPKGSGMVASREFVSMAFSRDGKYLLTQGGAPDWTLVNWSIEKARPVQSARVSTQAGSQINQVSFCPVDSSIVCVTGNGVLRFLTIENSEFKSVSMNMGKREPQNYLSHCWIDERAVVGTDTGDLLLFENGEFQGVLESSPSDGKSIDCIVAYSRGFVCGCDDGVLYVFERDDKEFFKLAKSFQIDANYVRIKSIAISPSDENIICTLENNQAFVLSLANVERDHTDDLTFEPLSMPFHYQAIVGLDVCVRKPFVVTCGMDRSVRVWNYLTRSLVIQHFFDKQPSSVAMHPSGLIMLVGLSDSLNVMNVLVDELRLLKDLPIKACRECRFSNGGQYFAAVDGPSIQIFSTYTCERLGSFTAHKGRVRSIFWLPDDASIVSCGMDGQVIQWRVASSIHKDFVQLQSYKNVKCQLTSAVAVQDGKATARIFAVGTDRMVRVVDEGEAHELLHNVMLTHLALWRPNNALAQMQYQQQHPHHPMQRHHSYLFAGTDAGVIRALSLPLSDECVDIQAHSAPVTRVALSHDLTHLFTVGEDGCLCIFEIDVKDPAAAAAAVAAATAAQQGITSSTSTSFSAGSAGGSNAVANIATRRRPEMLLPWAEEILVARQDLEDKAARLEDLQRKVERAMLENKTEVESKDDLYKERRKELEERYQSELSLAAKRISDLEQEKSKLEAMFALRVEEIKQENTQKMASLEAESRARIDAEKQRCLDMERQLALDIELGQQQLKSQEQAEADEIAAVQAEANAKIEQERTICAQLKKDAAANRSEFERLKKLIEEDADKEIDDLKSAYNERFMQERAVTHKLTNSNTTHQSKFKVERDRVNAGLSDLKLMKAQQQQLLSDIKTLVKDIEINNKETRERDSTVEDKLARISQLRRKNQELEKFKFVLDYKVTELRRQLEPRRRDVEQLKTQIAQMQHEVARYDRAGEALELEVRRLGLKHAGLEKALAETREDREILASRVRAFKADIHDVVGAVDGNNHKTLKAGVRLLYRRHVLAFTPESGSIKFRDSSNMLSQTLTQSRGGAGAGSASGGAGAGTLAKTSEDVHNDYRRQREYMERSLDSLNAKFKKEDHVHKSESRRILQENVSLIKEINELRRELHVARSQHHAKDAASAGFDGSQGVGHGSSGSGDAFGASMQRGGRADGAGNKISKKSTTALALAREIEVQQEQIRVLKNSLMVLDAETLNHGQAK